MNHSYHPLPKWFRVLFVSVMLLLCLFLCWYAQEQYQLDFQFKDVTLSLDTSRQREAKQNYENQQYKAELPVVQAQVAETEPLAAAALATETDLRAQRKALREKSSFLDEQLQILNDELPLLLDQAKALQAEVDALTAQQEKLRQELARYHALLP